MLATVEGLIHAGAVGACCALTAALIYLILKAD